MLNTQDRTPTLPCWPTEVHLFDAHLWLPGRDAVPMCHLDNSATKDKEQGPLCWVRPGTTQWPSCFKCLISWPPLLDKVTILCRTNCVSAQWCQNILATCHHRPTSRPWILLGWSHWWKKIQTSPGSHLWAAPQSWAHEEGHILTWQCSSRYTRMAWSTSSAETTNCTRVTSSAKVTSSAEGTSCSCNSHFSIHWSTTADWCSPCCPMPICPHL